MPILVLRGTYDKYQQEWHLETSIYCQNQIVYYKVGNRFHDQNSKKHTEEIFHRYR